MFSKMKGITLDNDKLNTLDNNNDVFDDGYESLNERMEVDILEALYKSVHRASKENRLIQGLSESAQFLDENPDEVMYCIIPADTSDDIVLQLHIKLLEAYCCENDIPLVKENCPESLETADKTKDTSCYLVLYPTELDGNDEDVIMFFQNDPPYSYLCG